MDTLRAWIATLDNGAEKLFLLDPTIHQTEAQVLRTLNHTWSGAYGTVISATDQTASHRSKINSAVESMCDAMRE